MNTKRLTAVIVAVILGVAILGAAYMLSRPDPPQTAEAACVQSGGVWHPEQTLPENPTYIDRINAHPAYCSPI
jgi:hypothetical protein